MNRDGNNRLRPYYQINALLDYVWRWGDEIYFEWDLFEINLGTTWDVPGGEGGSIRSVGAISSLSKDQNWEQKLSLLKEDFFDSDFGSLIDSTYCVLVLLISKI